MVLYSLNKLNVYLKITFYFILLSLKYITKSMFRFLDVANKSIISSKLMSVFLCMLSKTNPINHSWLIFDFNQIFNQSSIKL